jgi:hypothetical protein
MASFWKPVDADGGAEFCDVWTYRPYEVDRGDHAREWNHQGPAVRPPITFSHFEPHSNALDRTHNDYRAGGQFASGAAKVDLYAWDGYPLGFDCSHPNVCVHSFIMLTSRS